MLDALDITEAEAAGLTELAALDLAMARRFAERAQAAEDPEVANRLARSYQRAARSYRQTLALKARLKREIAQAAHAAEVTRREAEPHQVRLAKHKTYVKAIAMGFVEEACEDFEVEPDDFARIAAAVAERVNAHAARPDFLVTAPEDLADAVLDDMDPVLEPILRGSRYIGPEDDEEAPPASPNADTS
jgi:hypothetical protein